ncbi:unnamed protein product [Rhizoctonia solani]|uniref:Uncharacterized protein n=1 Tax=Rhizoctonia solani TaxID=456999 RepID=A0A8H3GWW4_9AGAM|nr:unnamed protein product [Rhizoctonia solani]CAE6472461.1 unnamed protein product [Rhizoctonia solani]
MSRWPLMHRSKSSNLLLAILRPVPMWLSKLAHSLKSRPRSRRRLSHVSLLLLPSAPRFLSAFLPSSLFRLWPLFTLTLMYA